MDYIDPKKITYLPNTAGCFNSKEALRTLRLAREIGGWKLVKLEVLGDKKNLFPDMIETLRSTEILTKEGFKVMVYCSDDPLMAKRLEDAGAVAIMPLAAPIGSGLGIQNYTNIKIIRNQTKLPVIIDAGIGQASDAAIAMELGCDGVLINTAIAKAKKPFEMAEAMKFAVIAGRKSFISGRTSFSGSLDMNYDETDTAQENLTVGSSVSFTLLPEGNTSGDQSFAGSGIVTSMSINNGMDAVVTRTVNFQGSGALTKGTV